MASMISRKTTKDDQDLIKHSGRQQQICAIIQAGRNVTIKAKAQERYAIKGILVTYPRFSSTTYLDVKSVIKTKIKSVQITPKIKSYCENYVYTKIPKII